VNAPELLRATFTKPSWRGDYLALSGNTDCYQPLETTYRLTRRILEICLEFRNPVGIVTKSALVRRDIDLLAALHREASVRVHVGIPFTDPDMARAIEPFAASLDARFATIRALGEVGVPVGVGVAPIIPGLNDDQVAGVLERAAAEGATSAFQILLRMPAEVKDVFPPRLEAALPLRRKHVESALRDTRGGRLNDSRFGHRMSVSGGRWRAIEELFETSSCRLAPRVTRRPGT